MGIGIGWERGKTRVVIGPELRKLMVGFSSSSQHLNIGLNVSEDWLENLLLLQSTILHYAVLSI